MKVNLFVFTHPQWHLMFDSYKIISSNYILSQIELEAKGYGIKNSIANFINRLSCTLGATNVLKYSKKGSDCSLMVSNQNLKPFSWRI
jgi:hypothetical protein